MVRFVAALASMVLAACATGAVIAGDQPGGGVDQDLAHAWGCNSVVVQQKAEEYRAALPAGRVYMPQVGWDACELLARVGAPRNINRQQSTTGRSAHWWYGPRSSPTLVRLEQYQEANNKWRVVYVGS